MKRPNTSCRLFVLAAIPFAMASGCAEPGPTDTVPGDPTVSALEAELEQARSDDSPDGNRPRKHHFRKGAFGLLRTALSLETLTAEQKTSIESTLNALRGRRGSDENEPRTAAREALAAGVRAGKIDPNAMPDLSERLQERVKRHHEALNQLHDVLTAAQRTALVARVRSQAAKPLGKDHPVRAMEEAPNARGHRFSKHMKHNPEAMLARHLDLSDDQREAWSAARRNAGVKADVASIQETFRQMTAEREALLDQFPKEDFDATEFTPSAGAERAAHERDRVAALNLLLPLLTEEQKESLADRFERGPRRRR